MRRLLLLLLALAPFVAPAPSRAASHCAPYTVTPVAGDPDAFRVTTARGSTVARRARALVAQPPPNSPVAEIRVFPSSFDADGDSLDHYRDTVVVTSGTLVRWVRRGPGFHTITNGFDSGDITAAGLFNYFFPDETSSVERLFVSSKPDTLNFFCFIHEPIMGGTIITLPTTTGVTPGRISKPGFSRPPSPNPSRGEVAFAIVLPRSANTRLEVHDVSGRMVAQLANGPLSAGEHAFRWDGRARAGGEVQSGRYFITLEAAGLRETRAVSLVR